MTAESNLVTRLEETWDSPVLDPERNWPWEEVDRSLLDPTAVEEALLKAAVGPKGIGLEEASEETLAMLMLDLSRHVRRHVGAERLTLTESSGPRLEEMDSESLLVPTVPQVAESTA